MGSCACYFKNNSDDIKIDEINGNTKITIDGVTYTYRNIKSLYNLDGNIYADGKVIIHTNGNSQFRVFIDGDTKNVLTTSGEIIINGNINGNVKTTSGDINVTGDIIENVSAISGNINITGNVNGNTMTTSGDIKIKNFNKS